jgi:two-component sensor histidine kinase
MRIDTVEGNNVNGSPQSNEYLLVRELTHRINNEFASVIGLASLIAARSTNDQVKEALTNLTTLLHKHAVAHRALEMPTYTTVIDASRYIRALCQSIRHAKLDYRDIELELIAPPLPMSSERCWKLAMIVSELITNSARHAFRDDGGKIQIELSKSGPLVECCVTDNGSSRGSYKPGEGLKIVEALAKELRGTIVHRFREQGAISMLLFPRDKSSPETDEGTSEHDQVGIDADTLISRRLKTL